MTVFKYREKWTIYIRAQDPVKHKRVQIKKVAIRQTKRGAEEEERQMRNALADGSYWREKYAEPNAALMYETFAEDFFTNYCDIRLASSTAKDYRGALRNHVIPVVGAKRLEDITAKDIATIEASMKHLSAKTVRNVLGYFQRSLNVAREWGHLDAVPRFELPKVGKATPKYLTAEEAQRYLVAAAEESEVMEWLVLLGLNTGMRFGEMVALRFEDIEQGVINVRRSLVEGEIKAPKSGHDRQVPMTATLQARLPSGTGYIVHQDGEPYSHRMLQRAHDRVQAAAQIPDDKRGWHTLRHTYASHLAMQGVPIQSISQLLGHSDVRVTMRYAHLSPSTLKAHVEKLDGLF